MRSAAILKRKLSSVRRAAHAGEHRQALSRVDELLQSWPDHPVLLKWRAELIQLQDDADAPDLSEAKANLQSIVDLDEQAVEAQIELGNFLFAIEDDANAAAKVFAKAANRAKEQLQQALLGYSKALAELDQPAKALASLIEAYEFTRSATEKEQHLGVILQELSSRPLTVEK